MQQNENLNECIHNSPFYKADWIIDSKHPMSMSSNTKTTQTPMTSLSLFSFDKTPSNYSVELNPITKNQVNHSAINFCVDGSCNPNPGMGA